MRVDLHNHTALCNHADGTIDEFIQKAIQQKIDIFGFSDHSPMEFDKKYRMKYDDIEIYESNLKYYKKKYKDDIEILIGYEVDFIKGFIEQDIIEAEVDYLIGSVHFLDNWGFDNPEFIAEYKNRDIDEVYKEYFKKITEMADSGLFDIVGHLDLIKVFNFLPTKDIKILIKESLEAIKDNNMVVEINSAGFRKPINEQYPSKEIIELCYKNDIPITFGSDAHRVEEIGLNYEKSLKLVTDIGYKDISIFRDREEIILKI